MVAELLALHLLLEDLEVALVDIDFLLIQVLTMNPLFLQLK